jgi:hypothetical protein
MPRGGRRSGTPGKSYPNRSDLAQPVRTATRQPYGAAKQQADAQHAIPLPQTPPVSAAPAPVAVPTPEPGLLSAPTGRPNEPLTAGMNMGAGPGPDVNSPLVGGNDQVLQNLYAAYRAAPTEGLRALIEQAERR